MFKRVALTVLSLVIVITPLASSKPVRANVTTCTTSVSPSSLSPGGTYDIGFNINNFDSVDFNWMQITRPSANYTIIAASGSGWNQVSNTSSVVTYGQGAVVADSSGSASVRVSADLANHPSEAWIIRVSDDPSGANAYTCTGNSSTDITGAVVDNGAPAISNLSVVPISSTIMKVVWLTDEPATTIIDYGQDTSYGNHQVNNSLTVNHTMILTDLLPGTSYHYQVASADASLNNSTSGDNTFFTVNVAPTAGPTGEPTAGPTTTITGRTVIAISSTPTEKTLPVINLTTRLGSVYRTMPKIEGVASDNARLARIDYSIDGGKNWLIVDSVTGLGTSKAKFSFSPTNLKDGNYLLIARAIDTSGNQATTVVAPIVIDQLPPRSAGAVYSIGPKFVYPDDKGVYITEVGLEQKVTLSVIGGPTSVNIVAKKRGSTAVSNTYSLSQLVDNGLWTGVFSFDQAGEFELTAKATDGAGNVTERSLGIFRASARGVVRAGKNKAIDGATIVVYTQTRDTNNWIPWDAEAYGQDNPIVTRGGGGYSLYLPAGKYYITVKKSGYNQIVSKFFSLTHPDVINADFKLNPSFGFDIGPIHFHISIPQLLRTIIIKDESTKATSHELGRSLPQFKLPMTNNKILNSNSLYGRPTVMTFINTWSEPSKQQLAELNKINNNYINVVAVGSGESMARLQSYADKGGYKVPIVADEAGELSDSMRTGVTPVNYFFDRHGVVKKVVTGVLSEQDIINNIGI